MAILHEHELHYRCSFQLSSSISYTETWGSLSRLIRSWIAKRFADPQSKVALGAKWFFVGGEWRPPKQSRVLVKTERCIGARSDVAPQWWVVRLEHPDTERNVRQWRTEIAITVNDDGRITFALSTMHWLIPGYIGEEPSEPIPTAPRIVSDVLNSGRWKAYSGSEQLGTSPILLRNGASATLLKRLQDPSRACPLVLVAKEFASGQPLLAPVRLARLLAGAAVVWESESSWVDKELEHLLKDFSCWNGMVRAYQPKVNLSLPSDARRHRYFDKVDIETLGVTKVEEFLVRGVVRRSRPTTSIGIMGLEDLHAKQAQSRFSEEMKRSERGSREWITLLEQEVDRLGSSIKNKDSEILRIQQYSEDADQLRVEIARLKFENREAIARARQAEAERSALTQQASLLRDMELIPSSILEVVDLIGKLYSDRIFFTEKSRESAARATLANCNIAWRCLRSVALVLHDLHFQENLAMREICRRFREKTGFELAASESESTRNQKKLSAMRRAVYKGKEIDVATHIKYGTSPGNILRVHYYVHRKDNLLVIGHCGDHLDTSRTN